MSMAQIGVGYVFISEQKEFKQADAFAQRWYEDEGLKLARKMGIECLRLDNGKYTRDEGEVFFGIVLDWDRHGYGDLGEYKEYPDASQISLVKFQAQQLLGIDEDPHLVALDMRNLYNE